MLKEIIIDFNFSLSSFNVIFNKDLYMDILLRCARLSCDKTFFQLLKFFGFNTSEAKKNNFQDKRIYLEKLPFLSALWIRKLVKIGLPSKNDVQTWNLLFVQKINLKGIFGSFYHMLSQNFKQNSDITVLTIVIWYDCFEVFFDDWQTVTWLQDP